MILFLDYIKYPAALVLLSHIYLPQYKIFYYDIINNENKSFNNILNCKHKLKFATFQILPRPLKMLHLH